MSSSGLPATMTMSAPFPAWMEPTCPSTPHAVAAVLVLASRACIGVRPAVTMSSTQ